MIPDSAPPPWFAGYGPRTLPRSRLETSNIIGFTDTKGVPMTQPKQTPEEFAETTPEVKAQRSRKMVDSVADLLERNGIDPDDVAGVEKVKLYQGYYKDGAGVAHVVDMTGITLSPSWETGPEWPVVQPGPAVVIKPQKITRAKRTDPLERAMTLPDIQVGYYRDNEGNFHPTHDEAAIDVALQLVRLVQPSIIVLHGDNADFPEASKYRLTSAFAQTTQATIDRLTRFGAELRAVAGADCAIYWLEGNHEVRLPNYLLDNARAAFGLKRGNAPDSWPVLSVPYLCRLDDVNIKYVSGYPANEVWINERLRVVHGHHVVSNGSTAHRYLSNERASIVYGHIHRREWAERTRSSFDGPRTILAMSPGCLARTDGGVPSTKGGTDLNGVPIPNAEDWQQGVAVFAFEPGDGRFIPEQVPIIDGWTIYHGQELQASVDVFGDPVGE